MGMVMDTRAQAQLGYGNYDPLRYAGAQFTNPWSSTNGAQMYNTPLPNLNAVLDHQGASRDVSLAIPYPTASSLGQDFMHQRSYLAEYAQPNHPSYAPSATPQYSPEYVQRVSPFAYEQDISRQSSYQPSQSRRNSFSDALDASQGMVALSQDITPRNIYGNQESRQGSHDSYGFPSTHSTHSSISSSSYPSYYGGSYNGSVDGSSVTDYSSASEDTSGSRMMTSQTQATNGFPPELQSMMTQFNSKSLPGAQKKHKCKICDKRFTRPSSLQTHMYSHTGEKPFACDYGGCGRHFSVVSNLRRHRKVHKDEHDHPSPDD